MSSDFISVIIPSGRPDRVIKTVNSLLGQSVPREMCEIVVVTPDSDVLDNEFPDEVIVISTGDLFPPGRMRNIGAQVARGSYLFFIDDDCLAPENFLEYLLNILETKDHVGAVGCRVIASDATFWNRCADHALFTAYQSKQEGYIDGLGSAALAVRQDVFSSVGGFDEELMASEDWDFSLKLSAQGWRCWFTPELEVIHDHRRGNLRAIIHAAWRYGTASGLTVQRRHKETISWLACLMVSAANKRMYWLLMLPYSCLLTLVWLLETRPTKLLPCLPVIFFARLSYQCGVYKSLHEIPDSKVG